MQKNQQLLTNKHKYVQPHAFPARTISKSINVNHCKSMMSLDFDSSAEKENIKIDHYDSIASIKENNNVCKQKAVVTNNHNNRYPLVNQKNISNIAKILLNSSSMKMKLSNELSKNGSFDKPSPTVNVSINKKSQFYQKNYQPFFQKTSQMRQARCSSQTSLKQIEMGRALAVNNHFQSSREKNQPQKYFNNTNIQEKQTNFQQMEQQNLILKLKKYIENLKRKLNDYEQKVQKYEESQNVYQKESILFNDKIKIYQIREKQMIKKIKDLETQINKNSQKNIRQKVENQCNEHFLIIQSLRNVINEQMSKIIELQTYKVKLNQQKIKQIQNTQVWNSEYEQEIENSQSPSTRKNLKEVYSFKKNLIQQQSIYIQEEQSDSYSPSQKEQKQNIYQHQLKNKRSSRQSIPEPYHQLIQCLKSDSRIENNIKIQTPHNQSSVDSEKSSHSSSISNIQDQIQNYTQKKFKRKNEKCEQDEILEEVGQYLSYIRKNVRES